MNVLVTGGAGYIGTELVNLLLTSPSINKIVVYDNLSRGNYNFFLGQKFPDSQKLSFVKGELLDSRSLRKALDGIDVVYHLAAKATTPFVSTDAHVYEQVNHWGTAELVYAVEESNVKRFIYTSSTGVYGSSSEAVDETVIPDPKTPYAISKLRGEDHVRRLGRKIETYILRCGNVYGYSKSMRFDAVINKFVFEANVDKRVTVQGDGKQSRSFIHVDLLAGALNRMLTETLPSGTYNVVERSLKVFDVVDVLKQLIPSLEFIFINQHMSLHQLTVKENTVINEKLKIHNAKTLSEELTEFISKFSF